MSDTTINQFVAQVDDDTARLAFVPSPPTPAAGPPNGYFLFQRDTGAIYCWNSASSAWVLAGGAPPAPPSVGTLLTADPGSPDDDTWWVVRDGTSPTMVVSLKVRIAGVTYTVASITL